jgi:hypothetical protein
MIILGTSSREKGAARGIAVGGKRCPGLGVRLHVYSVMENPRQWLDHIRKATVVSIPYVEAQSRKHKVTRILCLAQA